MKKMKLGKVLCAYILAASFLFGGYPVNATELELVNDGVYSVDEVDKEYFFDDEVVRELEAIEYNAITVVPQWDGFYSVGVPNVVQIRSNWCWAGASAAVIRSTHDITVSQLSIARRVLGNDQDNVMVNVFETAFGIRGWNTRAAGHQDFGGAGVAISELRAGLPLIAGYVERGWGHMVVISAYDSWWDDYRIMDPAEGRSRWISARTLSPLSGSQKRWFDTVTMR